jgi:polysaccharide chain length determinant protein (PEP-CTERM system associated)
VIVEREVSQDFIRPSVTSELETRIQSIHQQVMSRDHLAGLIDELGLYPDRTPDTPLEDLVNRFNQDVTLDLTGVEQTSGGVATISFEIGFTGRDRDQVATVANRLAEVYVLQNGESRRRQAEATATFLRGELDTVKKELDTQEAESRSFTLAYTNELPQQVEANLAALERLQAQLSANNEQQVRLLERRERLEQELSLGRLLVPAADPNSPAVRLQTLRQQLDVLRRTFSDEYPDVKRVRAEIAVLEAEVAQAAKESGATPPPDPVAQRRGDIASLQNELQSLEREADGLRANIARYEALVSRAPRRQVEMDRLSTGRNLTRQRYEALLKQYEDAQLAATLEDGQGGEEFRILDAAVPPARPVGPDRLMLAGMGAMGALGLAFLAVFVREKADPTVHSPEDLRGLLPEHLIVPVRRIRTTRQRVRAIPRAALATLGAIVVVALCAGAAYFVAAGNERLVKITLRGDS